MRAILPQTLRKQWARVALRNVHFADKHQRLDVLYRMTDPWEMETPAQRFRFKETNRLVQQAFGRVHSILEIGAGEGHQSKHLHEICDELVGVDISPRAIERARQRCPTDEFLAGDVFSSDLLSGRRFELVLGCEVLYYVKDVQSALNRLNELGDACLVTYYRRPARTLDPFVLSIPGVESTQVDYETCRWTVAWWQTGRA